MYWCDVKVNGKLSLYNLIEPVSNGHPLLSRHSASEDPVGVRFLIQCINKVRLFLWHAILMSGLVTDITKALLG